RSKASNLAPVGASVAGTQSLKLRREAVRIGQSRGDESRSCASQYHRNACARLLDGTLRKHPEVSDCRIEAAWCNVGRAHAAGSVEHDDLVVEAWAGTDQRLCKRQCKKSDHEQLQQQDQVQRRQPDLTARLAAALELPPNLDARN